MEIFRRMTFSFFLSFFLQGNFSSIFFFFVTIHVLNTNTRIELIREKCIFAIFTRIFLREAIRMYVFAASIFPI